MAFAFTFSPSLTLASCFVLCYLCWVGAKAFPPSGLTNSLPTNVSERSGGKILPHPGKTGVSKRSSEEIKAIRLLCWELPPPNSNTLFIPPLPFIEPFYPPPQPADRCFGPKRRAKKRAKVTSKGGEGNNA